MKNNTEQNRFELEVEGQIVFATYSLNGDVLHINHVETPISLRGKGAAGELMREIMDYTKARNLKVVPICGYAAAWMKRHHA